jgi:hypothetical protein
MDAAFVALGFATDAARELETPALVRRIAAVSEAIARAPDVCAKTMRIPIHIYDFRKCYYLITRFLCNPSIPQILLDND